MIDLEYKKYKLMTFTKIYNTLSKHLYMDMSVLYIKDKIMIVEFHNPTYNENNYIFKIKIPSNPYIVRNFTVGDKFYNAHIVKIYNDHLSKDEYRLAAQKYYNFPFK